MRRPLLISLLLATLFFACNRDAADATMADNGRTIAPASAPTPMANKGLAEDERPLEAAPMVEPELPDEKSGGELTEEELHAMRRLGPARQAGMPKPVEATPTPQPATQPSTAPEQMSAPPSGAKPVLDYGRPLVTLHKTACYGGSDCKQYSISMTADRRLVYKPGRGTDKQRGTYTRTLTAAEYDQILAAMESSRPESLAATYPTDPKAIPDDVQGSVITYADVYGEEKIVEVYADAPEKVVALLSALETWTEKDFGWIKAAQE